MAESAFRFLGSSEEDSKEESNGGGGWCSDDDGDDSDGRNVPARSPKRRRHLGTYRW